MGSAHSSEAADDEADMCAGSVDSYEALRAEWEARVVAARRMFIGEWVRGVGFFWRLRWLAVVSLATTAERADSWTVLRVGRADLEARQIVTTHREGRH